MCVWEVSVRLSSTLRTRYCRLRHCSACSYAASQQGSPLLACHEHVFDGRYDTRLTEKGKAQAVLARKEVKALFPKPAIVIASPLTRALQTAELAFGDFLGSAMIVEPLCSERIWLSSDVGRQPSDLQQDFPNVNIGSLEDMWWHNNGSGDVQHVLAETPGNNTYTTAANFPCNRDCQLLAHCKLGHQVMLCSFVSSYIDMMLAGVSLRAVLARDLW